MGYRFGLILLALGLFSAAGTMRAEPVTYQYVTIDAPGATNSTANGINNAGQIVGAGFLSDGFNGFLDNHGVFTTINAPGNVPTSLAGINDRGQIVVQAGENVNYVYSGGTFAPVQVPGAAFAAANGINNAGQVVGYYDISGSPSQGFVDTAGVFTTLSAPGAGATFAQGISNTGEIVGTTNGVNSFLYRNGAFTTISAPNGGLQILASGVNGSGQIVGTLFDSGGQQHAFLDTGGVFTAIDFPGAQFSNAFGINDAGQIVGDYGDSSGHNHGFLATPTSVPEPASVLLFAGGLAGLGIAIRPVRGLLRVDPRRALR